MTFRIYQDEHYPVYTLVQEEDGGGWIPNVDLPEDAVSEADWAKWRLVIDAYDQWQEHLGKLYKTYGPEK